MLNTDLQFLSDTFQFEVSSTVTESGEDDDGSYVITAATVFYPGGGGQEPDKGSLITESGIHLPIQKAILKNQTFRHYYASPDKKLSELTSGKPVSIHIDQDYRLKNAQLHTGGHLLSSVVYEKLKWPLIPAKGFHYQKGAYIEFEPEEEIQELPEATLIQALTEDIAIQLPITTSLAHANDLAFQQAFKPQGFVPPADQPLRLVRIAPYLAYPCGGTHLHHTGEINHIRLKHIRLKKGRVRISYDLGE